MNGTSRGLRWLGGLFVLVMTLSGAVSAEAQVTCAAITRADVVALDQPYSWNRFGAVEPHGMIYALKRDVLPLADPDGLPDIGVTYNLVAGQVQLRRDKRPRPLVLRVNEGDCLQVTFTNLLNPIRQHDEQPDSRWASMHVVGLQLSNTAANPITGDGTNAGQNTPSGIVAPGGSMTYTWYAPKEGGYVIHSYGAPTGGQGDSGSIAAGLFGAVNVEPKGSEWYRSQVTRADMNLAATSFSGAGFPVLNYNKLYPAGNRYQNLPVLKMYTLSGTTKTIVHSDLTALITGANAGNFLDSYPYVTSSLYPQRKEPFREFTIIFHDEIGAVQAFPQFEDREMQHTLHSVRDAFAINYGTGGAGAEVISNRIQVGPAFDCPECKYEEFFLSSWALGDPAMVVDIPANAPCTPAHLALMGPPTYNNVAPYPCAPTPGPKATRAYYPDDPSNVYHSYLSDHVKFRNLHAGSDDHHIFHLHAHQWVHTPKEDNSSYLDSQAIGQGGSFTYEIAYEGSGNRNKTPGDSIFHCHFYPHFAQGMWSLWRVHDVLELGTTMDNNGRPALGSRAYPDNEIHAGTPIPGVVPVPTIPMAPVPGVVSINNVTGQIQGAPAVNPGYPFFVPGIAGRRAPRPPLDTVHDGGLPRHVVVNGTATSVQNRLDFSKVINTMAVNFIPETGTPLEIMAMNFHNNPAGYTTPTPKNVPTLEKFLVNTRPPVAGAPFADPCPSSSLEPRYYKAANIQIDAVFNKAGWHFPQERIITLWNDVAPTLAGTRPPEPFFFRANSNDCIVFWSTNLVPHEYELDDFQVRTPTDILGQHIHLVKFDVMASDGGGNGWNYEDGTFSPGEVRERIAAIRAANGCGPLDATLPKCPVAQKHPVFSEHIDECTGENEWLGAQTTVQRWWADPITRLAGGTRTLRTVFTHDHFGPSSHQQAGLYAGLIVEKEGSLWFHNETSQPLGVNSGPGLHQDGGPTSWQAVIEGPETFREFMLEFQDFALAYEPGGRRCPDPIYGFANPRLAINPPGWKDVAPPQQYEKPVTCPVNAPPGSPGPPPPCPEAVSAQDPGTKLVNYRNEPIPLRILDIFSSPKSQSGGIGGDLSWAYASLTNRSDPEFNTFPYAPFLTKAPYGPLTGGLFEGDPYTPLLRAYEGDTIKVRSLVGAHEASHNFTVHGLKWLREPDAPNSGYRNSQGMGISEWFDLEVGRIPALNIDGKFADFLYKPGAASESQWDGLWGIIRTYRGLDSTLRVVSNNTDARAPDAVGGFLPIDSTTALGVDGSVVKGDLTRFTPLPFGPPITTACPTSSRPVSFDITAVWAQEVLRNDGFGTAGVIYNRRNDAVTHPGGGSSFGPLHMPDGIMFVYTSDLIYPPGQRPLLNPNVRREPLILRANSGDCIRLTLHNDINPAYQDLLDGWNSAPMIVEDFNLDQVKTSLEVGLHPQLVMYDVMTSDGANVGLNPIQLGPQTVAPGNAITYYWYAGSVAATTGTPFAVEFGATGLTSSDPMKHSNKGAVGAMIIEPAGAGAAVLDTVTETDGVARVTRASATIPNGTVDFREFVFVYQDDVNLRYADLRDCIDCGRGGEAVANLITNADPEDSGQKAINYRTEPIWFRGGWAPETPMETTRNFPNFHLIMHNNWVGQDPETPIFRANLGNPTRLRVVHPGGHEQPIIFDVHGHIWQEQPYLTGSNSRVIGDNATSEWLGFRDGLGPSDHHDAVLKGGAGGMMGVRGDYVCRDYSPTHFDDGLWNLLRVQ